MTDANIDIKIRVNIIISYSTDSHEVNQLSQPTQRNFLNMYR